MATIQVRVSDKDKKAVQKVLDSLGLDVTSAVRVFFKRIIFDEGIPFPVSKRLTVNGFTPEFEAEVLKASKDTRGSISFDSPDEAVAHIRRMAKKE